ncbi:MAG: DUF4351 domain-containing protein [Synechococcus sp.]
MVICPHRQLDFGNPTPVREFLEHRVRWIELQPRDGAPSREPLTQVLSLLLQPEDRLRQCTDGLRQQAISDPAAAEVLPLIPAIQLARFNDRPLQEICVMGGITLEDFTQSRAYREIFGLGEDRGRQEGRLEGRHEGRRAEACSVTLRLLARRCGPLSDATTARIQALPLEQLEALAEALLDFSGPDDLTAWLAAHG